MLAWKWDIINLYIGQEKVSFNAAFSVPLEKHHIISKGKNFPKFGCLQRVNTLFSLCIPNYFWK